MPETLQLLRSKADTATPDPSHAEGEPVDAAELGTMPIGCNRALLWLRMVDAEGATVADTEPSTVPVTVVPTMVGPGDDPIRVVGESAALTSPWPVRECIDLAMPPGCSFVVEMGAVVDPPAGLDALEVWWLPYRA